MHCCRSRVRKITTINLRADEQKLRQSESASKGWEWKGKKIGGPSSEPRMHFAAPLRLVELKPETFDIASVHVNSQLVVIYSYQVISSGIVILLVEEQRLEAHVSFFCPYIIFAFDLPRWIVALRMSRGGFIRRCIKIVF